MMEEKINMCLWHVHLHYITKNIKIPFWYKIIYYLNNSGTTIECPKYIPIIKCNRGLQTTAHMRK